MPHPLVPLCFGPVDVQPPCLDVQLPPPDPAVLEKEEDTLDFDAITPAIVFTAKPDASSSLAPLRLGINSPKQDQQLFAQGLGRAWSNRLAHGHHRLDVTIVCASLAHVIALRRSLGVELSVSYCFSCVAKYFLLFLSLERRKLLCVLLNTFIRIETQEAGLIEQLHLFRIHRSDIGSVWAAISNIPRSSQYTASGARLVATLAACGIDADLCGVTPAGRSSSQVPPPICILSIFIPIS